MCSWAILSHVVDSVYYHANQSGEQTGDYIYIKDPLQPLMRLYKKTSDELEEDEDEEEL
jgi:hypothetical protein